MLSLAPPRHANYHATVVALKSFEELSGCDNVQAAIIFNSHVIVSKTAEAGELGLFFPPETALSHEFLAANNLYRKPEWGNVDPNQKGFFEENGRVKAVRFRGHKSEGFWIPLSSLAYIGAEERRLVAASEGAVFDSINGHQICKKYVRKHEHESVPGAKTGPKKPNLSESIAEGQFRKHYDTENFRRNAHKVAPTDLISVTDKWHGTSVIISNVLVKRELNWFEKLLIKFGVQITEDVYGQVYSSRNVVLAVNGVQKSAKNFYGTDVYGLAAKEVLSKLPTGFTVYGEIVGFDGNGKEIQKGYSYGCAAKTSLLVVYRVTSTGVDGNTLELSWPQVKEFCDTKGLVHIPELFYGRAQDWLFIGEEESVSDWQQRFLIQLEGVYAADDDCIFNPKGTPAEGVVIRVDKLHQAEAFKLKNFRFLERETKNLDKGVPDMEADQALEEEAS